MFYLSCETNKPMNERPYEHIQIYVYYRKNKHGFLVVMWWD